MDHREKLVNEIMDKIRRRKFPMAYCHYNDHVLKWLQHNTKAFRTENEFA